MEDSVSYLRANSPDSLVSGERGTGGEIKGKETGDECSRDIGVRGKT